MLQKSNTFCSHGHFVSAVAQPTLSVPDKRSLYCPSLALFPTNWGTHSKTIPRPTDAISRIRFVDAVSQYFRFLPPQTGSTLIHDQSCLRQPSFFLNPALALSPSLSLYLCFSISFRPRLHPPPSQPSRRPRELPIGSSCSFNFSRALARAPRTHTRAHTHARV